MGEEVITAMKAGIFGFGKKDVAEDRFVAMDGDIVEIWITSGEAEIVTETPEGA